MLGVFTKQLHDAFEALRDEIDDPLFQDAVLIARRLSSLQHVPHGRHCLQFRAAQLGHLRLLWMNSCLSRREVGEWEPHSSRAGRTTLHTKR